MRTLSVIIISLFVVTQISAQPASDRSYFDFLIGTWKADSSFSHGRVWKGGKDVYHFERAIKEGGIISDWLFNRGNDSIANYTNGRCLMGYDNLTKQWSFYFISPTSAHLFEARKENDNWIFYKNFNINNQQFTQRQYWVKAGNKKIKRVVESSYDSGVTWNFVYQITLIKAE